MKLSAPERSYIERNLNKFYFKLAMKTTQNHFSQTFMDVAKGVFLFVAPTLLHLIFEYSSKPDSSAGTLRKKRRFDDLSE